jgi:hypothetical protein
MFGDLQCGGATIARRLRRTMPDRAARHEWQTGQFRFICASARL